MIVQQLSRWWSMDVLVLAAGKRGDGSRKLPMEAPLESEHVALALGLLLIAAIVAWIVSRRIRLKRERPLNSPRRLFRELCRVHKLNYSERRLLAEVARWHELSQPALLFVDASRWHDPELAQAIGKPDELKRLAHLLFADEDPK